MFRRLDHVGIAVNNLDQAILRLEAVFGLKTSAIEDIPDQGVRAALVPTAVGRFELLQPTSADSAMGRFIARRGEGLHHVCFGVDNLTEARSRILERGGSLIQDAPRDGLVGTVDFVHPRSTGGVLVEIAEITLFTPSTTDLQFHHITIRTADHVAASDRWVQLFGARLKRRAVSQGFQMATSWLDAGDAEVEFAQQTNDSGPVARAIRGKGEGLHAVVLESRDPALLAEHIREQGIRVIVDEGESDNVLRAIHPVDFVGTLVLLAKKTAAHAGMTSVAESSAH
ncbi:MAG: methylmalonyl-CoA epimerase [Chloroflexi bacterium]|nr:methylmalonyl-CoA epimerase [Chloroflexota bacterium]